MTSSTVPSKFSNGPSLILTRSPRSTSIRTLGALGRRRLVLLAEHLVDFGLGHLGRRAVRPDEVADAGGLADDEPGLLVQLHLDHDVAGIRLPLDDPLLVVADLGDLLGRNDDPAEVPLEPLDLDPALEGVADRVLARALDLQDVPDQFRRRLVVVVDRRRRRRPAPRAPPPERLGRARLRGGAGRGVSLRHRRLDRCRLVRPVGRLARPRAAGCSGRRRGRLLDLERRAIAAGAGPRSTSAGGTGSGISSVG